MALDISIAFSRIVILLLVMLHISKGLADVQISGLVGETVSLPCEVNRERCGGLHSIRWYKSGRRVFVFSELGEIDRAETDLEDRAELLYNPNATSTELVIHPLLTTDEGLYKCDITYLNVKEKCAVAQFVQLNTLAIPKFVNISVADGAGLHNASLLGPFNEGTPLGLLCEAGGGKPVARLSWWNGSKEVTGEYTAETEDDGTGVGRNQLSLILSRGDLGAKLECRAENEALKQPMLAWVEVDVFVRPSRVELSGVEGPVTQGSLVTLLCRVEGARPAATVIWWNGTEQWPTQASQNSAVQSDGTYETQSRLTFTVTRFENGQTISCEASNQVMEEHDEAPIRSPVTLHVLYPPAVTVSPTNTTVNETTDILLFCTFEANPSDLRSVRWYRDGERIILNPDKYVGGTIQHPSLLIKNSTRYDQGVYKCVLENLVGTSESENVAYVFVYFKPIVKLTMDPETPVSETERLNVTLTCDVEAGNPEELTAVRWYLDGELLKELPECRANNSKFIAEVTDFPYLSQQETDDFCNIDPSKLLLEAVGRSFHGNYSCEGMNEAGWGLRSPYEELIVHYPPSSASIVAEPPTVIKGKVVTLYCSVDDHGRPESTTFQWMRGTHIINDVYTANWTITSVTLETKANFSCRAVNMVGEGEPATVEIEVFAPPAFIDRLPPYHGALMNAEDVSISCRVECSPSCRLNWLKNGKAVENSSHYTIKTNHLPPDPRTSDFESVVSTLKWNMSAWPNRQLDRIYDNANYTCESSENEIGPGVSSTTSFRVEYPPENISISASIVDVNEGDIPEKVACNAKSYPESRYRWEYGNQVILIGDTLKLDYPILRDKAGDYHCIAYTRHGNITAKTKINVLYKPECSIIQRETQGNLVLTCNVLANPEKVDFTWVMDNITISEHNVENRRLLSILTLPHSMKNFGTYLCFANNSVGMSIPCEIDISGTTSWVEKFGDDNIIIISAIIGGAVLMLLIVCIVILIVCRRKRAEDKYSNPVELEERENPDGQSNLPSATVQPIHKWPIRPGVQVHMKGLNTTLSPNGSHSSESESECVSPAQNESVIASDQLYSSHQQPNTLSRNNHVAHSNHNSQVNYVPNTQSNMQNESNSNPTIPLRGKIKVNTCKKSESSKSMSSENDCTAPSPSSPNGKAAKQDYSPNKELPDADSDKFYENLAFHGLQPPPNKLPESTTLRPYSRLSQNGSSGYGSARSQYGPILSRNNSNNPTQTTVIPNNSQTHTVTIHVSNNDKSSAIYAQQHQEMNNNDLPKSNDLSNKTDEICKDVQTPVPAPRTLSRNKHTYQNIPMPKYAKSKGTDQESLLNPLILTQQSKVAMNNKTQNCSSRTYPMVLLRGSDHETRNHHHHQHHPPYIQQQHHSSVSTVPIQAVNPYVTDGIVYADLALSNGVPKSAVRMRDPRNTEYAVLKFREQGKYREN